MRGGGTEIPLPVESRLRKFWVNLDRRLPIVLQNNMDEVPTAENALCPGGGARAKSKGSRLAKAVNTTSSFPKDLDTSRWS